MLASQFLRRTAAVASCVARPVLASTAAAFVRPLHSSSACAHVQPDWPQRSGQFFRDLKAQERVAEEAAKAAALASAVVAIRAEHPHPLDVSAEVAAITAPNQPLPPAHFAVFRFRNEQYKAVEDDVLMMNLVDAKVGDKLVVEDVLLLGGRDASLIGRPCVAGARVTLQVEEHTHTAKVVVFKKKRRKGYKKKQGHREEVSMVRVLSIQLPEGTQPLTTQAPQPEKPAPLSTIDEELRLRLRANRAARQAANEAKQIARRAAAASAGAAPVNATGARAFSTLARRSVLPESVSISPLLSASFHSSTVAATSTPAAAAASASPTNEAAIDALLRRELSASALRIEDTSGGCGAFFRLLVVSPKFSGLSLVKQHRLVNETLKPHIANLHGLTLTTFTEEQWKQAQAGQAQ